MRTILGPLVILALASQLLVATPATALDVVYVTRHAQKEGQKDTKKHRGKRKQDPWQAIENGRLRPLTVKGADCAAGLAEHLEDKKIAAVYSSETARTLSTAAAVSGGLDSVGIVTYEEIKDAFDEQWAECFRERHKNDGAILVVGHSDTVGKLVLAFRPDAEDCLHSAKLAEDGVPETQYGDLWRIDLRVDAEIDCPVKVEPIEALVDQKIQCSTPG